MVTTNLLPNGQQTVYSYKSITNDQRLAGIVNQSSGGGLLSKFDYTYDSLGQITSWGQQTDAATNVWVTQYDPVNQLLAATVHANSAAGAILKQYAYAYDAGGNRTTEQIGTGSDGPVAISQASHNANNQLTSRTGGSGQMLFAGSLDKQGTVTVGGNQAVMDHSTSNFLAYVNVASGTNTIPVVATDYSGNSATNTYQVVVTDNGVAKTLAFDANGNQTSVVTPTTTTTYTWDAANRLLSVVGPTNESLFTYDGLGRRVQITEKQNGVAISTNKFVWDGTELREQRNNAGGVVKRFYGEGEQISGANYYFTKDHLGSIREMTDSTGTLQARYEYDPYGRRTRVLGAVDADFGFTGHFTHAPSGLCLTLYRAYDSELGKWLSRDPIEEQGGINLYNYVINNPICLTDPSGLCVSWEDVNSAEVAARLAFRDVLALQASIDNIRRQLNTGGGPDLLDQLKDISTKLPAAIIAAQNAARRAVLLRNAFLAGRLSLSSRAGLVGLAGAGGWYGGRWLGGREVAPGVTGDEVVQEMFLPLCNWYYGSN